MKDINYALVETTRPPIYTAMKYWGKKPHNIWAEYIKQYTPEDGVYLDPFCGSAISVIEALKLGRKAIGFDLNPLSTFMIEVFISDFDFQSFKDAANKIIDEVYQDNIYQNLYHYDNQYIHHVKWDDGIIYEIGLIGFDDKGREVKSLRLPDEADQKASLYANNLDFDEFGIFYPNESFPKSPSFSASFINAIGGNNFSNIWTKRNLYVLALIFNKIINSAYHDALKKQLLFGFIQTIHLCTKMSVPRNSGAERPFSTSWGRSAYICAARQMEQNPLYVFKGSCFGKQSVESCLKGAKNYFPHPTLAKKVSISTKRKSDNAFNLKYGTIDINLIDDYLGEGTVDFIITDPPYGGLVQYLDLSYIWLVWLKHFDTSLEPNFNAEITVKKGIFDTETYQRRFTGGLKKLYNVLKDEGKLVLTFHNKEIEIWNSFLRAVRESGFVIEKVIHQQNMRAGESVVANPYGTSGTDFYIRCVKSINGAFSSAGATVDGSILSAAIQVISARNEPTPYQILFNGILAHLSSTGQMIDDFDSTVEMALKTHIGSIFTLANNDQSVAGHYWWFINPRDYIKFPDVPLSQRVELSVVAILRNKSAVTLDDVLRDIFIRFPNGLTPDKKSIDDFLKKYASKSGGKWLYKSTEFEPGFTKHTEYLKKLSLIGKRLGYKVFIGKREQPEKIDGKTLASYADMINLNVYVSEKHIKSRLEMVDMVWVDEAGIQYLIEVENSTTITSAIQRASNANKETPKLIVIPDSREKELINIRDQFFVDGFRDYSWKYVIYSDIDKIASSKQQIVDFLKDIAP